MMKTKLCLAVGCETIIGIFAGFCIGLAFMRMLSLFDCASDMELVRAIHAAHMVWDSQFETDSFSRRLREVKMGIGKTEYIFKLDGEMYNETSYVRVDMASPPIKIFIENGDSNPRQSHD